MTKVTGSRSDLLISGDILVILSIVNFFHSTDFFFNKLCLLYPFFILLLLQLYALYRVYY